MCTCHSDIDAKLAPLNGRLATGFTATDHALGLTMLLQVEKINSRGKKPPQVLPTFCPFCGEKLSAFTPAKGTEP